jgi:hypothetical protein
MRVGLSECQMPLKMKKSCRTWCGSPLIPSGSSKPQRAGRGSLTPKAYGRFSGVIEIFPRLPFKGFTVLSFDPFFTGVFFIFVSLPRICFALLGYAD